MAAPRAKLTFLFWILIPLLTPLLASGQGDEVPDQQEKRRPPKEFPAKQDLKIRTLDNQLSLLVVRDTTIPVYSLVLALPFGSNQPLPFARLAAGFFSQNSFSDSIREFSGMKDAVVRRDFSLYRLRCSEEQLPAAMDHLYDWATKKDWSEAEFAIARKASADFIQKREEHPQYFFQLGILERMYGISYERMNPVGNYISLNRIEKEQLAESFQKATNPAGAAVVFSGPEVKDSILSLLETRFEKWELNPPLRQNELSNWEGERNPSTWEIQVNELVSLPFVRILWNGPDGTSGTDDIWAAKFFCAVANSPVSPLGTQIFKPGWATRWVWEESSEASSGWLSLSFWPNPDSLAEVIPAVLHHLETWNPADWEDPELLASGWQEFYINRAQIREKNSDWLMSLAAEWITGEQDTMRLAGPRLHMSAYPDLGQFVKKYFQHQPHHGGILVNSIWREIAENLEMTPVEEPVTPAPAEMDFSQYKIYFESNSLRPDQRSLNKMAEVASFLNAHPEVSLYVNGYTDGVGNGVHNYALSIERADTIHQMLIQKFRIDPERLEVRGYGEAFPDYPNDTPEHRALNRRVTFEVRKEVSDEE